MQVQIEIQGVAPLLMHNVRLANPSDPIAKQMKAVSSKRGKTEEDHAILAKLEFLGSLYFDPEIGVYLPALNIERTFVEGARASKKGKLVESGFRVEDEDMIPIDYEGPTTPEDLYDNANFVSTMPVRVQQARVMRTRPIFREWSLSCTGELDTALLNVDDFREYAQNAGVTKGLGDYRPRFGRFSVTVEKA